VNEEGIICLKTRLANADVPTAFKNPIILPREHPVTRLIIRHAHEELAHSGIDGTLNKFLGQYFCCRPRRLVKTLIHGCPICRRDKAVRYPLPPFPALPETRVKQSRPFEVTGLDYLGHFWYKEDTPEGEHKKIWVIILTCFSTRSIHLETSTSMEARDFLFAFRRFCARRGVPSQVLSDNAAHIVLSREVLTKFSDIRWKHTPPLAPWQGGVYERLNASIKAALRRALGRQILPYGQFCTFLTEVEGILNQRPISFVSDDPKGVMALRPVDFLLPHAQLGLAEPEGDAADPTFRPNPVEKLTALWVATTRVLREFWARWSQDYLLMLRQRNQMTHKGPRSVAMVRPKVGHIVLVEMENLAKNEWPLGRIVSLDAGQRSAQVLMANGNIWGRPVSKLAPLEAMVAEETEAVNEAPTAPDENGNTPGLAPNAQPEARTRSKTPPLPAQEGEGAHGPRRSKRGRKPRLLSPDFVTGEEEDENESVSAPIPTRPRGIIRWSTVHPSGPTMLTMLLIFCLFGTICAHSPEVLKCTENGVGVQLPPGATSNSTCCEGICDMRPFKSPYDMPLPADLLAIGYICLTSYPLRDGKYEYKVECHPPNDPCTLIKCILCFERIMNPQCAPLLFALGMGGMLGILIVFLFITFGLLYTCFSKWKLRMTGVRNFPAIAFRWPFRRRRRSPPPARPRVTWHKPLAINGVEEEQDETNAVHLEIHPTPRPSRVDLERRARAMDKAREKDLLGQVPTISNILPKRIFVPGHFRQPSISGQAIPLPAAADAQSVDEEEDVIFPQRPTSPSGSGVRLRSLTRYGSAMGLQIILTLAICALAYGSIDPIAITANTEQCHVQASGTVCDFSFVSTFNLLPSKRPVTMVLKDPHGREMGILKLVLEKLEMVCQRVSLGTTISSQFQTDVAIRCPWAGSCRGGICARMPMDKDIPELRANRHMPGANFCREVNGFLSQLCPLPVKACLFYRIYAVQLDPHFYELVHCPSWQYRMEINLALERPVGMLEELVTLVPGGTHHWTAANLTLAPSPLGQAPIPVLTSKFLINSTKAALVPYRFTPLVECPAAQDFSLCKVDLSAAECHEYPGEGTINCTSEAYNLEKFFNDKQLALPLNLRQIHLYQKGSDLLASADLTPVNVVVEVKGARLVVEDVKTTCTIVPSRLVGCYNCNTGGKFTHWCKSSFGVVTATVVCADYTHFTTECSPSGTKNEPVLSWTVPSVQTQCQVDCGHSSTSFNLNGTLIYLDRVWEGKAHVKQNKLFVPAEGITLPQLEFLFRHGLASLPQMALFLLAGCGVVSLCYLFLHCTPAFSALLFANGPMQPRQPTVFHVETMGKSALGRATKTL
jgi:hypothetical protein